MKVTWTPEMDATLLDMRARYASIIGCADRIGVAGDTVRRRIRELGLPVFKAGRRKAGADHARPSTAAGLQDHA